MNPSKFHKNQPAPQQKKPAPIRKATPKKKGKSFWGIIISDIKNLLLIVEEHQKEPDDCWENWEGQL